MRAAKRAYLILAITMGDDSWPNITFRSPRPEIRCSVERIIARWRSDCGTSFE